MSLNLGWDVDVAVDYLNTHAEPGSKGRCAQYVRLAVAAGGIHVAITGSAKDYGRPLQRVGFFALPPQIATFRKGDIAIIQPIPGHPHGHMTMFNGRQWISDFRQNFGYYPGASYRRIRPSVTVYRFRYM